MRLIGSIPNEKDAHAFHAFLLQAGIANTCEPDNKGFRIWVQDEDNFETAAELLEEFRRDPNDPKFERTEHPFIPPKIEKEAAEPDIPKPKSPFAYFVTYLNLIACVLLFLWNGLEEAEIVQMNGTLAMQISMSPIEQKLLFDYPAPFQLIDQLIQKYPMQSLKELKELPQGAQALYNQAEAMPTWKGIVDAYLHGWDYVRQIPMFEKIRQGEVWRLFTPVLLHGNILHILFNMAWLWILGKQIEERISKWKMLLLILLLGIIPNVAQYLMSGPYFLGYSGIAVGMVGFIWMRQKVAPWEGYPLQKGIVIFLLVFVIGMFALGLVTTALQLFTSKSLPYNIANTAHIAGGLVGMALGKWNFFARKKA